MELFVSIADEKIFLAVVEVYQLVVDVDVKTLTLVSDL
jgi:hypothetical protein